METNFLTKPIPPWVRIYGFGILVFFMLLLIIFSFFFKIERVAHVKVEDIDGLIYLECGISEYEAIKTLDTAEVSLPSSKSVTIVLNSQHATLHQNKIRIPVSLVKHDGDNDEVINLEGVILVEKSTLLSKIFERPNKI